MPEHAVGLLRFAARQHLRIGQGVVEEVRLDLRVQQVEARDREFLFRRRLLGGALFVAAALGDSPRDRAGDRLGILEVGAVVDAEPIGPRAGFRFADQGDAAGAVDGLDGGGHLVAEAAEPVGRIQAREAAAPVHVRPPDLGAQLQAVACAFDFLAARQFADGRVEHVEGLAGFERDLDLPPLAAAQGALVDAACDQAHPAHVRYRTDDGQGAEDERHQHEQPAAGADRVGQDDQQRDEQQRPSDGDAQDEEGAFEHGGLLPKRRAGA